MHCKFLLDPLETRWNHAKHLWIHLKTHLKLPWKSPKIPILSSDIMKRLKTYLKHPWNLIERILKHPGNHFLTPMESPENPSGTLLKSSFDTPCSSAETSPNSDFGAFYDERSKRFQERFEQYGGFRRVSSRFSEGLLQASFKSVSRGFWGVPIGVLGVFKECSKRFRYSYEIHGTMFPTIPEIHWDFLKRLF